MMWPEQPWQGAASQGREVGTHVSRTWKYPGAHATAWPHQISRAEPGVSGFKAPCGIPRLPGGHRCGGVPPARSVCRGCREKSLGRVLSWEGPPSGMVCRVVVVPIPRSEVACSYTQCLSSGSGDLSCAQALYRPGEAFSACLACLWIIFV